ncbi:hypothetical protein [Sorangium sp. So ce388]|uniref:hypothetical protein n=1 Tax=Sorangium sp. So ce388 TaxID=3133309 RepID=UPI003F5C33A3
MVVRVAETEQARADRVDDGGHVALGAVEGEYPPVVQAEADQPHRLADHGLGYRRAVVGQRLEGDGLLEDGHRDVVPGLLVQTVPRGVAVTFPAGLFS